MKRYFNQNILTFLLSLFFFLSLWTLGIYIIYTAFYYIVPVYAFKLLYLFGIGMITTELGIYFEKNTHKGGNQ